MRSFHLLSLLSVIPLVSCSPSQAKHLDGHEKLRFRHRHANSLSGAFDTRFRRDANAAFTYFADGQGACGATNGPNDFIVALNSAEYGDGAHCFEMVTITINGKTAQAQIVDKCSGCLPGGLDFSQGLFGYFAALSEGELYGSWSYNNGLATSSSTLSTPATYYTPTPTTAMTTPTSTSLPAASPTTRTTSLGPTVVTSSTSSISIAPTSAPQDPQVITQINVALLELGSLLGSSFKL